MSIIFSTYYKLIRFPFGSIFENASTTSSSSYRKTKIGKLIASTHGVPQGGSPGSRRPFYRLRRVRAQMKAFFTEIILRSEKNIHRTLVFLDFRNQEHQKTPRAAQRLKRKPFSKRSRSVEKKFKKKSVDGDVVDKISAIERA